MELNVSFFIQLGAFLLTLGMLSGVVFGPLLQTLEEREKRIEGARLEASRLMDKSGSQAGEIDRKLSEARAAGQAELSRLKAEGEKSEAELLQTARQDAARKMEEAKKDLQSQSRAAQAELKSQAKTLAELVATRVLGRAA